MATINVRRATTQDAAAFARVMGHPEVLGNLMQVPYTSEELWRARLADIAVPGKPDLLLVAELDGDVVGTAGLHPAGTALRRRHAMMLGISVLPEAQGQGGPVNGRSSHIAEMTMLQQVPSPAPVPGFGPART